MNVEAASDVPDPRALLGEGTAFERAGVLDRALRCYRLVVSRGEDPTLVGEALWRQSRVHRCRCDWSGAIDAAKRAAEHAKISGNPQLLSHALNEEAAVYLSRGEFDDALPLFERILTTTDDPRRCGDALQNLASIAAINRDFPAAEELFGESYDSYRRAEYERGTATAVVNFGAAMLVKGEFELAESVTERGVGAAKQSRDQQMVALAVKNHAEALASQSKRLDDAEAMLMPVLGFFTVAEDDWRKVECLRLLGDIRVKQRVLAEAVRAYELALQRAHAVGARIETGRLELRLNALGVDPERVIGRGDADD